MRRFPRDSTPTTAARVRAATGGSLSPGKKETITLLPDAREVKREEEREREPSMRNDA